MGAPVFPQWLIRFCTQSAVWGLNFVAQSTVVIVAGLLVAYALRRRGAATQSAALRLTLLAVVVSPAAWWSVREADVRTFTLPIPVSGTAPIDVAPRGPEIGHESAGDRVRLPARGALTQDPSAVVFSPVTIVGVVAAGVWAAVVLMLLIRLARCQAHVRRCVRAARPATAETVSCCVRLAGRVGVRPPTVLVSPMVAAPALVGVRSPTVLLPDEGPSGRAGGALEGVLLHELAHLRRRDVLWNWLGHLLCALGFFQPLVWCLARRLEEVSDLACDDYAVHFGGERRSYAQELFRWATVSQTAWREAVAGAGVVHFRSSLGRRIVRIVDESLPRVLEATRAAVLLAGVVLSAGVAFAALVGFRPVAAQEQEGRIPSLGEELLSGAQGQPQQEPGLLSDEADDGHASEEPDTPGERGPERREQRNVKWVSEDAFHLYRQAQDFREEGDAETAEELMGRAERMERTARREQERRREVQEEGERREERFRADQAYELYEKAEELAREGRSGAADELLERAERIEREYLAQQERRERRERREREREEE